MPEKRRDNKGRVLRDGESYRSDGRYMYRYTDAHGVRRTIYSYRLVRTDKAPEGKRSTEPLREQIEQINADIRDGINRYSANECTLDQLFEAYISMKFELKDSTRCNYRYTYKTFIKGPLGHRKIGSFHFSDIKKFYISMIADRGLKPNSVENLQTVLHPTFQTAVRDGLIRINPTEGVLTEVKKSCEWEKPKRHALTVPQQERLIGFVKESREYRHWLPLLVVLLGTGGRIGEILGLRWCDCDFERRIITIDHTLIYRQLDDGKMHYQITTPKTKAGERIVPMLTDVQNALEEQRKLGKNKCVVDGFSGFIFQNRFGEMLHPHVVNRAIDRIICAANYEENAVRLPHFSVHNLRHTFCTRMCENETNLKVVQEIMGHRSIETTMDIYNEATKEKKMETFAALEGKMSIGGLTPIFETV